MLDFYLRHGVKMMHIYCIITFRVVNWLKPYIELNTALRNEAKRTGNVLGITVFKGMNNFIYGKFLQNVFKQTNLKFLNTLKMLSALKAAWICEEHLPQWQLYLSRCSP